MALWDEHRGRSLPLIILPTQGCERCRGQPGAGTSGTGGASWALPASTPRTWDMGHFPYNFPLSPRR